MLATSFLFMNHHDLIKELILLTEVRQNLEHLVIYNPDINRSIEKADLDLNRIKRALFFRYKKNAKLDLNQLAIDVDDLQSRMRKYLD